MKYFNFFDQSIFGDLALNVSVFLDFTQPTIGSYRRFFTIFPIVNDLPFLDTSDASRVVSAIRPLYDLRGRRTEPNRETQCTTDEEISECLLVGQTTGNVAITMRIRRLRASLCSRFRCTFGVSMQWDRTIAQDADFLDYNANTEQNRKRPGSLFRPPCNRFRELSRRLETRPCRAWISYLKASS